MKEETQNMFQHAPVLDTSNEVGKGRWTNEPNIEQGV